MRQYLVASCLSLWTAGSPSLVQAAPSGGGSADDSPEPPEFEVRASLEHWARYYGYRNRVSGALREYALEGAPALGVGIGWLPFAWPNDEARTGFRLNYSRLLHAVSRIHDAELQTESHSLSLGLKASFMVAAWAENAYELLYGEHSYTVADTFVPDPHYRFIRPGTLLRVKLWRLRATAAAGIRLPVDTGDLESPAWYPEAGGLGLDAELTCGVALTEAFVVLVGVRWQRYRFNLNPNPMAPSPGGVARAALDVYLDTFAALNLLL
jgi:hypothetical protein